MKELLKTKKYNSGKRPSQHRIGANSFLTNNNGAIPSNVLSIPNTSAIDPYLDFCRKQKIPRHPSRMPPDLAKFFILFLTEKDDIVLDPFAGSNVTGFVAETCDRRWISIEKNEVYACSAISRFDRNSLTSKIEEERLDNESHNETSPRNLRQVNLKSEYNTEDDNIIRDLYRPCLKQSTNYDRAVGYFRANIYRELGEDLLDFVINGGKVRIVTSPDISESDEQAAREGYSLRGMRSINEREADLLEIMETMSRNPKEADCLDMLRLLIEKGSLDLYVAVRRGGIYHRKIGMFSDSLGNKVVFSGSGNETSRACVSFGRLV